MKTFCKTLMAAGLLTAAAQPVLANDVINVSQSKRLFPLMAAVGFRRGPDP